MQLARIQTDKNGVLILLRVKPRAGRNQIEGVRDDRILISVTAAPHDGEANNAVIEVLADALRIAKSRIEIVRGHKSREKTARLHEISEDETRARLEPFLPES